MSRCFPYPPPGYARKVARTEAALIETIKLQSERRESKTDRKKEGSKHKKEKSKDKKHKSKEHKEKSSRSRDHKRKKGLKEANDLLKGTKVEAEQLEKSGLTEEHGQPVWPQSPGYLSDGTQINHKRKRDTTLQPNEGCKPGKIIRIKLSSSLSQQEDTSASREPKCSTSGREHLDQKRDGNSRAPVQVKTCFTNAETAVALKDPTSSKHKIKDPSSKIKIKDPTSHVVENLRSQGKVVSLPPQTSIPVKSAHETLFDKWAPPPRTRSSSEVAYEALFDKWVPPLLQFEQFQLEQQTDDEEWLSGTRKQDGRTTNKPCSPAPSCRSSSTWPRGQYLADADVYSLPYTIPF